MCTHLFVFPLMLQCILSETLAFRNLILLIELLIKQYYYYVSLTIHETFTHVTFISLSFLLLPICFPINTKFEQISELYY